MNVIKKSVLISVILLVATLSLPGCETKKENKEATLTADFSYNDQPYWNESPHPFCPADGGYYYTDYTTHLIMFYDPTTQEYYPVCSNANCEHKDKTCNAWLGSGVLEDTSEEQYYQQFIYSHNGILYITKKEADSEFDDLVSFNPQTGERKVCCRLGSASGSYQLTFHDNYVFFYNIGGSKNLKDNKITITKASLDGKESEEIYSYQNEIAQFASGKSYGDGYYFLIINRTADNTTKKVTASFNGLYKYSYAERSVTQVSTEPICDYCISDDGKNLYYYVYDKGAFKQEIGSTESQQIFTSDSNSTFCQLNCDQNYLYVVNQRMESISQERIPTLWVLDRSNGNTVTKVLAQQSYFGDKDTLFILDIFDQSKAIAKTKLTTQTDDDWTILGTTLRTDTLKQYYADYTIDGWKDGKNPNAKGNQ